MPEWEMNEIFTFPSHLGSVTGASLHVKPNWQQEEIEDSIVLKGVYVIKGNVQFDFVPLESEQETEGIFIEHIDIDQDQAYFEYAIPFSIDFPKEGITKVAMRTSNATLGTGQGTQCQCSWNVHCDIEKQSEITAEPAPVEVAVQKPEAQKVQLEEGKIEPIKHVIQIKEVEQQQPHQVALQEKEQLENEQEAFVEDEVDFLNQLAEAYSIVQVHLNKVGK